MQNQDPTRPQRPQADSNQMGLRGGRAEIELQPKKNPFTSHEFLYFVIGVLLLVVIGGSVYLYQAEKQISENSKQITQSPATGWKTYTNTEHGFEFKYPSGFDVAERMDGSVVYVAKGKVEFYEIGSDNSFFTITRGVDKDSVKIQSDLLKNFKTTAILIDGKQFQKIEGDDIGRYEGSSAGKVVIISNENYLIKIEERPGAKLQNFDVLEMSAHILSTFKFVDTQSVNTEDWKTYTNSNYPFSFKYPDNIKVELGIVEEQGLVTGKTFQTLNLNYSEPYSDNYSAFVSVFSADNLLAYNWDDGWVYFNSQKQTWYSSENVNVGAPPTAPFNPNKIHTPAQLGTTMDKIPIYENYGYGDAGFGVNYYIIPIKSQNVFVVFELQSAFDVGEEYTDEKIQELNEMVDKIEKEFEAMMKSFKLVN